MFWIMIGSITIALGAAVALGDSAWHRSRARRRELPSTGFFTGPITHGDWMFGDPRLAAHLFTTLCRLRKRLRSIDRQMPAVHSVLTAHDRLVLRLANPAPEPPTGPWGPGNSGTYARFWALDVADAQDWEHGPAPYPTLVEVGRYDGWTVLVDLAQSPGIISIDGDPNQAYRLLHLLASGLATSPWSRAVTVLAVGFDRQVAVPEPTRIRYLSSAAEAAAHAQTISNGPLALLLTQPPGPEARLESLLGNPDRPVAVACLGRAPSAGWQFEAGPDGRLHLHSLGLLLDPARPGSQPAAEPTDRPEPARLTKPVLTERDRNRQWPATVHIDVLGPLAVTAPRDADEQHLAILTDLASAVALHPDGLPSSLVGPLLATADVSTVVRRIHDWLGADQTGLPRLRERYGVWRLSPDVRVDWQLFRELAGAPEPETEWHRLASALAMIRGELLAGAAPGPMTAQVLSRHAADVQGLVLRSARRAAELATGAGDAPNVEWSLRQGVTLLPQSEDLWRLLLQHQAQHDPARVEQTAEEMFATLAARPGRGRLERPTRELLTRLGVRAQGRHGQQK